MTSTHYFFTDCTECTRSGFKHVSILVYDGHVVGRATCHYANRTWEPYQYHTSRSGAVEAAIETLEAQQLDNYKRQHGYERMTVKRLQAFREWLEKTSSAYADYRHIYATL